ncbi:MAG: polysaccharide biosynthesis/export family protein [Labilithrix sp.]|nr:polysaccharide biosynthesis/export family protein [Labilithrix sp.]MCW5811257.1 polysaccharide biosynthesis/export family protein [Labilithrix sp.]
MGRLRSLLLALAVFSSVACGATVPPYDYAKEPDPRKSEYEIGALDQIRVTVWKNPDLSAETTVRPDGIITLPLIGDVKAAGRTPTALQKEITKRYGEFVRLEGTTVNVGVAQVNSYSFTVSGNVEKAGVYKERNYVTVLEAIALAGGANKYAGNTAFIVRSHPSRKVPIDLKRAAAGEIPEENVVVIKGDIIVVQ